MSDQPPSGPAPLPRLIPADQQGETRLAVLRVLVAVEGPLSIADIAPRVDCHPNSARAHLDALAHDGIVERTQVASGGRGRPHYRYAAAPGADAALRAVESSDLVLDEYRGLVAAFATILRSASADLTRETARDVGRAWAQALPGPTTDDDADRWVLDLLRRLGFSPRRSPASSSHQTEAEAASPERELVELRTCPLLEVATEFPDVVCEVHHGLLAAAHASAGGVEGIELVAFAAPGACHVYLPEHPTQRRPEQDPASSG